MNTLVADAVPDTAADANMFKLFGVRLHPLKMQEWNRLIEERVRADDKMILANHNLNSVRLCQRDEKMRDFYRRAQYAHIDGMPLVFLSRLLGHDVRREHRVTYIDWTIPLMTWAAQRGWRVFYLGSKPGVAETGAGVLRERLPSLQIATHSGYFDVSQQSTENQRVLGMIRAYRPNLLLVGMGMPRQEHWILDNIDAIQANVILPSGACIDYVAGAVSTPPRWMGRVGMEWLYRLGSEPQRLWKRYLVEPWALLPLLGRELIGRASDTRPTTS
jgi:N-acetylglucosaminyldiphosphoundecaprenol N-acetyl-beta-D-mannosaminyltransferase